MNTWSADTGTFVLCIAAVLGLVAAYLARAWDKWEQERTQYVTRSKRNRN